MAEQAPTMLLARALRNAGAPYEKHAADVEAGRSGPIFQAALNAIADIQEQLRETQAERDFMHRLVTEIGVHCEGDDAMVPLRIENDSDASVGMDGRWSLYLPDGYEVVRECPT